MDGGSAAAPPNACLAQDKRFGQEMGNFASALHWFSDVQPEFWQTAREARRFMDRIIEEPPETGMLETGRSVFAMCRSESPLWASSSKTSLLAPQRCWKDFLFLLTVCRFASKEFLQMLSRSSAELMGAMGENGDHIAAATSALDLTLPACERC